MLDEDGPDPDTDRAQECDCEEVPVATGIGRRKAWHLDKEASDRDRGDIFARKHRPEDLGAIMEILRWNTMFKVPSDDYDPKDAGSQRSCSGNGGAAL